MAPTATREFIFFEQASAAQSLALTGPNVPWWQIVSAAQVALAQAHVTLRDSIPDHNIDPALLSAARMLDNASRA